jgi:hypothetical protein
VSSRAEIRRVPELVVYGHMILPVETSLIAAAPNATFLVTNSRPRLGLSWLDWMPESRVDAVLTPVLLAIDVHHGAVGILQLE